jgi:hypothetical protein
MQRLEVKSLDCIPAGAAAMDTTSDSRRSGVSAEPAKKESSLLAGSGAAASEVKTPVHGKGRVRYRLSVCSRRCLARSRGLPQGDEQCAAQGDPRLGVQVRMAPDSNSCMPETPAVLQLSGEEHRLLL